MVSVTPRPRFIPEQRTPGIHCTGGWVGLRAGLDTEATGKILYHCRGSNHGHPVVHCIVRHYTDWATPAPHNFGVEANVHFEDGDDKQINRRETVRIEGTSGSGPYPMINSGFSGETLDTGTRCSVQFSSVSFAYFWDGTRGAMNGHDLR
jgi:hypothetical protein